MNDTPVALHNEYLTFELGHEQYGLPIGLVQEIRSYESPTRLVGAPSHVLGIIDLRGTVVPIVDLRVYFGYGNVQYTPATVAIVLNINHQWIGMVVDAVCEVCALDASDIKPAPDVSSLALKSEHIIGVVTLAQRMVTLLDVKEPLNKSPHAPRTRSRSL